MPLPANPMLENLLDSAISYREFHGLRSYHDWLEHEMRALRITMRMRPGEAIAEAAPPQSPVLAEKLQLAEEALEFYADEVNWRKPRGNKPSQIDDDNNGDLARETLAKLKGEDFGDEGNGGGE